MVARQHDNTSYSSQQHSYTYILHSPFISISEEEEKKKPKTHERGHCIGYD
jgi:hypothetical protein